MLQLVVTSVTKDSERTWAGHHDKLKHIGHLHDKLKKHIGHSLSSF
jgi:hypothetical protein